MLFNLRMTPAFFCNVKGGFADKMIFYLIYCS